jgi:hypothetical protein
MDQKEKQVRNPCWKTFKECLSSDVMVCGNGGCVILPMDKRFCFNALLECLNESRKEQMEVIFKKN